MYKKLIIKEIKTKISLKELDIISDLIKKKISSQFCQFK